ncbi:Cytochrome P450 monooxygenase [Lachnellula subtilissima]|uniref:Cytochrome P450 monooxygenase n=1 Tax=Lachnellula subtilissima TaxID=602034 RepID=A0A8H8RCV8_9HELO|nr:Cytochrome P450 monooxygenase [Lachnellula subtilissima]
MAVLGVLPQESASQWILSLLAIVIFYFVGSAIYNLHFSPLAKYPGPFFSKISAFPSFYYALKGTRHIWIWQCHQIYGDVFRFHPNGLIINSPSGHNSIYGTRSNVKKGKFYEVFQNKEARNTLNTIDKAAHAKKRKVLNAVFSDSAVRSAETFVIKHVDRWCDLLLDNVKAGEWTEPKNAAHLTDFLVFDILGDLAFGRSFESKEPGPNPLKAIPHSIASYAKFMYPITKSPIVNFWVWMKPRGLDILLQRMKTPETRRFADFVQASVAERTKEEQKLQKERIQGQEPRKDMFHYLFQARDPETGGPAYTPMQLFSEATLLIIAGTDTTSTAMCTIFFYLAHNPHVYKKLTREVREKFGDADEIVGGPKLASCQYLRACIDESLRIAPPVLPELSREVLPGGLNIDGTFIPAGVQVGTSGWSLMHHDEVFGDPWVYRPERWIVDTESGVTAEDVSRAQTAFHPFSIGAGNCVGRNLAMQELLVTVGRLLYRMDVRVPAGDSVGAGSEELGWGRRSKRNFQIRDAYVAVKDGPMLQFKRRGV